VGEQLDSVDLGRAVVQTILGVNARALTSDKDGNWIVLSTTSQPGLASANGAFQNLNGASDAVLMKIRR